jgi:glycosyltransferase involved in cell wall biosynthesis
MVHDMVVPNKGGGAPRTEAAAKAFSRMGHDVFVMAPFGASKSDAERVLGCRVIPTRNVDRNDPRKPLRHALYSPILALRTLVAAKKNGIDVIFAHDSIYGTAALIAAKILRIRFVFDATDLVSEYVKERNEGKTFHRILSFGEGVVVRGADRIITVSNVMKSILVGMGARDVKVVYDGVDSAAFHCMPPRHRKEGKFVYVYQGGMDPQDGLEILVPAAKEVVKRVPHAEFWLVGAGKALSPMKEAAEAAGLSKHFMFTGWVPFRDVSQYISDADAGLVILPDVLSARIRVTLKTFEYWACGKPVIVADLDALREVVSEKTGLFYTAGDARSLAEKMVRMHDDKKLYARLASAGHAEAANYEWSRLGDEIARLSLSAKKQ